VTAATALDWYRDHIDRGGHNEVPSTPVGPDLAAGLSPDFGFDAMCAIDWEVALEVNILLTHGGRGPLPAAAVVELEGENRARADVAAWPNVSDYDAIWALR
jgi:hypothetical protein